MATQMYGSAPPMDESMSSGMEGSGSAPPETEMEGKLIVLEVYEDGTISVMSQGQEEQRVGSVEEAVPIIKSMAGMDSSSAPPEESQGSAEDIWNQVAAERQQNKGM